MSIEQITHYVYAGKGDVDVIASSQSPKPVLEPHDVLIRVQAFGINRADLLQRQGLYPAPPHASPIPGLEVSGTIFEVGSEVDPSTMGTNVCAIVNGGGYADYVRVPHVQCLPMPSTLTFEDAATFPEALFTLAAHVLQKTQLVQGTTILFHGGTSGIGVCALQVFKQLGCTIFTTCRNLEKKKLCKRLGADYATLYSQEAFDQSILENTKNRGVDVIVDMVGGDYFAKHLKILAHNGVLIQIGFMKSASIHDVDLSRLLTRALTITGGTLRRLTPKEIYPIAQTVRSTLWPMVLQQKIQPIIHKIFRWDEVAEAQRCLESQVVSGKVIVSLRNRSL